MGLSNLYAGVDGSSDDFVWLGIFLPSLSIYPNLAERDCVVSRLFLRAEIHLAFHAMDLLYGLREVGRKDDSFGMPALVSLGGRRGRID